MDNIKHCGTWLNKNRSDSLWRFEISLNSTGLESDKISQTLKDSISITSKNFLSLLPQGKPHRLTKHLTTKADLK
jgi:hypothetical protein